MKTTTLRPSFEEGFRQRLKAARERLHRSQADVARRAAAYGFETAQQPTIARIEAGDRTIGLDEAAALAQAVEMSLADMLWPSDRPPDDDADRAIREAEKDAQIIALQAEIAAGARRLTGVADLLLKSVRVLQTSGAILPSDLDTRALVGVDELVEQPDSQEQSRERPAARRGTPRRAVPRAKTSETKREP
jgi:transcriptional regulator with XRE-family HTH domain